MNRVIKFRVWHDDKMWPATIGDDGHVCIWRDDAEEIGNHCIGHCHESNGILKPVENLMQFTGLKDKNGVEIYEGDLIKIEIEMEESITREVVYHASYFGCSRGEYIAPFNLVGYAAVSEVVGNIFENKA